MTMRDLHSAAQELEYHGKFGGEWSPLKEGDRVVFVGTEEDYLATVRRDWNPSTWPTPSLRVVLDCAPDYSVEFHRTLFRTYTVLDRLADV